MRAGKKTELLPSPAQIAAVQGERQTLDQLVRQRVAEIMAERESLEFEPFFRSRQVANELRRLQTVPEQQKWGLYYERHGCLICERNDRIHAGNGMCPPCHRTITSRLRTILEALAEGRPSHVRYGKVKRSMPEHLG